MLKLKTTHHLDFPHITFSAPHLMQLSAVPIDSDELAQAIENDTDQHDNNWQLGNPDSVELEKFWSNVQEDIKNDPEWVNFAQD